MSRSETRKAAKPAERTVAGHPLGIHRVLDGKRRLPQAAEKLDAALPIFASEILISVERLNIDAASFVQMEQETKGDTKKIADIVLGNCRTLGKQQNRVTGSGGMLVGSVKQIGSKYKGPLKVKVGDRVATLVSLTLTPLHLDRIVSLDTRTHQIAVEGYAVLFESGIAAKLPPDLDENVALSLFDVAGAPAAVHKMCRLGDTVVVLGGGGKAGTLSCVAARSKIGRRGKIVAIEPFEQAAKELEALGVCDAVLRIDATDPIAVRDAVENATRGKMGAVVVNVASVPDTENSALLSVAATGKVLFFGMATTFSKVALGAEGIACGATLYFGNGYTRNHDRFAVKLFRENAKLRDLFQRRYGRR